MDVYDLDESQRVQYGGDEVDTIDMTDEESIFHMDLAVVEGRIMDTFEFMSAHP